MQDCVLDTVNSLQQVESWFCCCERKTKQKIVALVPGYACKVNYRHWVDEDHLTSCLHYLYFFSLRATSTIITPSAVACVNIAYQSSELNPNKPIKYTALVVS